MESAKDRLKDNLLECMVEAALCGHDLGPWNPVQERDLMGYEALCRKCGKSIYASSVVVFSYLEDRCPVADPGQASSDGWLTDNDRR